MLSLFKKKSTKYTFEQKRKMKRYTKENRSASINQLVMIGDSIIDFYDVEKFLGGYDVKVYNRGISGDTSDMMLARLHDNALCITPKTLFVLIGTNDISRGLSMKQTMANIKATIDEAKASNVENIYIESLYPVNANIDKLMVGIRTNDVINGMNEQIAKLCEENNVTYINIHDSLQDNDGNFDKDYTIDGLHPNHDGYEVVTRIIAPYIK